MKYNYTTYFVSQFENTVMIAEHLDFLINSENYMTTLEDVNSLFTLKRRFFIRKSKLCGSNIKCIHIPTSNIIYSIYIIDNSQKPPISLVNVE